MILCQLNHQWPPHVTVLGITMQQNHWVALTSDQIVKSDSVDIRETIVDGNARLRLNTCVGHKQKNEYPVSAAK
jgi:hypothetical protein